MQNPTRTPVGGFNCALPINTGGTHWALDAAVYWLNRWVVDGTPPPRALLLATTHVSPVVYKLDANGNAIGGVRTPQVDAPIAALGSQGNSGGFCPFRLHRAVQRGPPGQPLQGPRPVRLGMGPRGATGPCGWLPASGRCY